MDRRHKSIQPSLGSASATQQSDDVMMSRELYHAVFEGRKKDTMALLQHTVTGAVASAHQVAGIHNMVSGGGRSNVLHIAAKQGHHELIQELYASFGNKSLLTSQNYDLDTPLHCAASAGHERVASLLVKFAQGCGDESMLRCKNKAGDTALHLAAMRGHGAVVEVMVSAALELASEVNGAGESSLYLAVVRRSVLAVRAITSRCRDASAVGPNSENALHVAVFKGSEMVGLLLNWKPSLASEADGSGRTPLHSASSAGDHSMVDSILRAEPPFEVVCMKDSGGLSALHVAAGMGHSRVVRALIDARPDAAGLRDNSGGTFVHAAARGGYSKVVSLAIKDPCLRHLLDMEDRDGNTPLHLAVAACEPGVAEALLRSGKVGANVVNNDGHTALDLAAQSTSLFSMLGLVVTLAAFGAECRSRILDHVVQWSGRDIIAKGIEKTSDTLVVVAGLIFATAITASNKVSVFLAFDALSAATRTRAVHSAIYNVIYIACSWLFILGVILVSMRVSFCTMLKFMWQYSLKASFRRHIRQHYQVVSDLLLSMVVFTVINYLAVFGVLIISHLE